MARKSPVHIVGCTGFWGEALTPMHLWAAAMLVQPDGIEQVTRLYIKEITEGMEDPYGEPDTVFTDVKAGIIKIATSTYLTALERRANTAAGLACLETGCPISVHTTDGGGLEMAQLLLALGVSPQKIIIGHQGYKDDRENVRATDYHKQLADLGVWVQFDRIGYPNYPVEDRAEYIRPLLDAGYEDQLLPEPRHRSLFLPDVLAGGEERVGLVAVQGRPVDVDPVGGGAETERGRYHQAGGQQDPDRQPEEDIGVLMPN